jgi:hypothetical protein
MRKRSILLILTAGFLFGAARSGDAMPMFARKLGVECSLCHTTIPRLTEMGYRFRAAGFRLPEDIGKPETDKFNVADYFSGRIQARYDASRTKTGPVSSHRSQLRFEELTLYPMTGSFGKYFSSLVELSFAPEEPAEVENAYVRLDKGTEARFFEGRFGIFHPFEGYGASDRPIALSRPYFQTNPANLNQTTFFKPWGFDQAGVEAGVSAGRTSFRATVFNGLVVREEDGSLLAFAAQGGPISKPGGLASSNTVDFQLFANQILHPDGGGVSAYYYHGRLDLPIGGSLDDTFQNSFDRFALYGAYPVVPKLHLLAAFQTGRDDVLTGGRFTSRGAFAEATVPLHEYATAGVRYDWFDPATSKASNELRGVFGFLSLPFQNGLQFIAEYQHKNTKRGASPDRNDNIFQVRFIFIQ